MSGSGGLGRLSRLRWLRGLGRLSRLRWLRGLGRLSGLGWLRGLGRECRRSGQGGGSGLSRLSRLSGRSRIGGLPGERRESRAGRSCRLPRLRRLCGSGEADDEYHPKGSNNRPLDYCHHTHQNSRVVTTNDAWRRWPVSSRTPGRTLLDKRDTPKGIKPPPRARRDSNPQPPGP